MNGQVDKRNGQWEISLRSPILNTTFSADGTFENVKKGKSFSVSLENINLGSYSSEYGILDLEMTYEVAPLKASISNDLPQKTIYDILEMSEDDWTEIENEIPEPLHQIVLEIDAEGPIETTAASAEE